MAVAVTTPVDERAVILQLASCLREQLQRDAGDVPLEELRSLHMGVVSRLERVSGVVRWTAAQRAGIVGVLSASRGVTGGLFSVGDGGVGPGAAVTPQGRHGSSFGGGGVGPGAAVTPQGRHGSSFGGGGRHGSSFGGGGRHGSSVGGGGVGPGAAVTPGVALDLLTGDGVAHDNSFSGVVDQGRTRGGVHGNAIFDPPAVEYIRVAPYQSIQQEILRVGDRVLWPDSIQDGFPFERAFQAAEYRVWWLRQTCLDIWGVFTDSRYLANVNEGWLTEETLRTDEMLASNAAEISRLHADLQAAIQSKDSNTLSHDTAVAQANTLTGMLQEQREECDRLRASVDAANIKIIGAPVSTVTLLSAQLERMRLELTAMELSLMKEKQVVSEHAHTIARITRELHMLQVAPRQCCCVESSSIHRGPALGVVVSHSRSTHHHHHAGAAGTVTSHQYIDNITPSDRPVTQAGKAAIEGPEGPLITLLDGCLPSAALSSVCSVGEGMAPCALESTALEDPPEFPGVVEGECSATTSYRMFYQVCNAYRVDMATLSNSLLDDSVWGSYMYRQTIQNLLHLVDIMDVMRESPDTVPTTTSCCMFLTLLYKWMETVQTSMIRVIQHRFVEHPRHGALFYHKLVTGENTDMRMTHLLNQLGGKTSDQIRFENAAITATLAFRCECTNMYHRVGVIAKTVELEQHLASQSGGVVVAETVGNKQHLASQSGGAGVCV
jgi:hypothetical protein